MIANIARRDGIGVYSVMRSNLADLRDTISQSRLKAATIEWLDGFRWHFAITLSWNLSLGLRRARDDLSRLMGHVDRKLLKSHFHTLPSDKRTEAVFAFEGMRHDHVHVHSLWKAPGNRAWELAKLFPEQRGGVWNEIVGSGSYDVEPCNWVGGNMETLSYVLKQQHRFSEPELMVWASDFHRRR